MPEPNQNLNELQISAIVVRNLSSLKTLASILRDDETRAPIAASYLAKFKLWAGSLGAHRPSGSRSLEYRLRDASFIRNHILTLLTDLGASIDEGMSNLNGKSLPMAQYQGHISDDDDEFVRYFQDGKDPEESEVDQCLDAIAHVIKCLLRLSVTMKNPAPHDQFNSIAGKGIVEFYGPWDVQHIREKFPNTDKQLVERLSKAMARRRHYFKYREDHVNRLAMGLDVDGIAGGETTTIASSLPKHLKDHEGTNELNFLDDNRSDTSGTSYAPSIVDSTQLRVPPLPRGYMDGPFKCPFCHMFVSLDSRRAWKKHVFRDLRPYVCLSGDCSAPEQLYISRNDWARHMRQEHWKTWSCTFGCSEDFNTGEDFRSHIRKMHGQAICADNLIAFESLSGQTDPRKAHGTCPLCPLVQIKSYKQYESHVGQHLEQLALFSLPGVEEEEGEDDETGKDTRSYDDDDQSIENSEPRSMRASEVNKNSDEADDNQKNDLEHFNSPWLPESDEGSNAGSLTSQNAIFPTSGDAVLVTYLDNGRDPEIARAAVRQSLPFDDDEPTTPPRIRESVLDSGQSGSSAKNTETMADLNVAQGQVEKEGVAELATQDSTDEALSWARLGTPKPKSFRKQSKDTTVNDEFAMSEDIRVEPTESKSTTLWQCCNCEKGWWSVRYDLVCPECRWRRCSHCFFAYAR